MTHNKDRLARSEWIQHFPMPTPPSTIMEVQTAVERGDGVLLAIRIRAPPGPLVGQLEAVFRGCVAPASLEASIRWSSQAQWRAVWTWGIAHGVVADLLPMSKETLTALTQEILMVGCDAGTIKNLWSSIKDRHRRF
jgi:hypothetical protein